MGRPKKLWSLRVGAHGASVTVYERTAGGPIWLRWWVPSTPATPGHDEYRALAHNDRSVAEQSAREIAGQLIASTIAEARGTTLLVDVLAAYQSDVADFQKGAGPREGKRRALVWSTFLGATYDVTLLDSPTLDRFVRARREGAIKLPETSTFTLRTKVTDRAIGADLEYLRAALNHATQVKRPSGKRLLAVNPMVRYAIPKNKNPRRPLATYDRFLKVMEHADAVDPQKLFSGFLGLVEALGWRVSAICALHWSDVDLTAAPATPHGRLFKRADFDKEGRSMWLPLSKAARESIDRVRAQNPGVGEMPLFPAPRARVKGPKREPIGTAADIVPLPTLVTAPVPTLTEMPKPWSRHHARKLLERAENTAKLGHQEGSDFHAYRRKWATERKHLPDVDVAAAGAWADTRALKQSYQTTDEQTLLAVMSEPTKLRDVGAIKDGAKQAEGA